MAGQRLLCSAIFGAFLLGATGAQTQDATAIEHAKRVMDSLVKEPSMRTSWRPFLT